MEIRKCLSCGKELEGRADRKFCSSYCKTAFHYDKHKAKGPGLFEQIDRQLRLNRRVLKEHNRLGKTTMRRQALHELGFDPNYFTHYWKNQKGQVYLFCYEYGFMSIQDNGQDKYLLVQWQEYMSRKN